MLSAGDMKSCLRKLNSMLRVIKYPKDVDYCSLSRGDPAAFLPILSFSLTSFSPLLAEQLLAAGLELTAKSDLRFTDTLYKILRDMFQYKPMLSKQQFLHCGFSQWKISVTCDVINLVLQRHTHLKKLSDRSVVVSHRRNPSTCPKISSHNEAFSSHDDIHTSSNEEYCTFSPEPETSEREEEEEGEEEEEEEEEEDGPQGSQVEARLSALEAQLERLVSGLDRLSALEARLEKLESCTHTEIGEQSVTISRRCWDSLQSRVLLLETKLELSSGEVGIARRHLCSDAAESSFTRPDTPQDDVKDKLERITNMMKTTSSLLER